MKNKFYAVQMYYDGFGNDTATIICFPTKKACKKWIKHHKQDWDSRLGYDVPFKIVKQKFGKLFEEYWG